MGEFDEKTDEELETMREASADNASVPSSVFHKIGRELERRHKKRVEESLKKSPVTIGILNQGENNKFIGNTFEGFDIGIKDQGKSTKASGNRFFGPRESNKNPFWGKPEFWIVFIIAVLSIPFLQPYIEPYIQKILPLQARALDSYPEATSTPNLSTIFSKINSLSTSLEKETFIENYKDTTVYGAGSFRDISRSGESYMVDMEISNNLITCQFGLDTEKNLLLFSKGQKINFTGVFTGGGVFRGGSVSPWYLINCLLAK